MAYKMKGPSMYPKMTVQRNGYKNMPDGRSESSAFQQKKKSAEEKSEEMTKKMTRDVKMKKSKEKTFEDYMNEGFSPAEARQMAKDGAVTGYDASPNKFLKGLMGGVKNIASGKGALGFLNPAAKIARTIGGSSAQGALDNLVNDPGSMLRQKYKN